MKTWTIIVHFLSWVLATVVEVALVPFWMSIYEKMNPEDDEVALFILIVMILSLAIFIGIAAGLPNLILSMTKESRLWKKLKKSFPKFAKASIKRGELRVHWFEGYRESPDVVHNYVFDFKNDTARFHDSLSEKDRVWFEGTVNEGVAKLL